MNVTPLLHLHCCPWQFCTELTQYLHRLLRAFSLLAPNRCKQPCASWCLLLVTYWCESLQQLSFLDHVNGNMMNVWQSPWNDWILTDICTSEAPLCALRLSAVSRRSLMLFFLLLSPFAAYYVSSWLAVYLYIYFWPLLLPRAGNLTCGPD